MKSRSRFGIVSALVVAMLALLYVLPAFAANSLSTITGTGSRTLTVGVYAGPSTNAATTAGLNHIAAASVATAATRPVATEAMDTKVGSTIYVAAASSAYDQVFVRVVDTDGTTGNATANGNNDTVTVTVKNITTGASINGTTLTLNERASAGYFRGLFQVTTTGGAAGQIAAADTNVIRVSYAASGASVDLTVDAVKPAITSTTPANGSLSRLSSAVFGATITDAGSGLRADGAGEDLDNDGTNEAGDRDSDGITSGEPMTTGATGQTKDIGVNIGVAAAGDGDFQDSTDFSKLASLGWSSVTNGWSFAFTKGDLAEATTNWEIVARDRVGNKATTDADGTAGSVNAFKVTVDKTAPAINKVETGIGFNSTTKKEKLDSSSLKVTFTAGGTDAGAADFLSTTTLDTTDFRVETSATNQAELAIDSLTHPNVSSTALPTTARTKDLAGSVIDTRNIVYIKLAGALAGNAKPRVKSVGNYSDAAGNPAAPHSKIATDKIAPSFTVTITGASGVSGRPVNKGAATSKLAVTVVSDEPLNAAPTIKFINFKWDDATDDRLEVRTAGTALTGVATAGATNTWTTSATQAGSGVTTGLVGVHVTGTDKNGNAGKTAGLGAAVAANVSADLSKIALAEFDAALPSPTITMTPTVSANTTESTKPFIKIAFGEAKESQINTTGGDDPASATPVDSLSFAQVNAAAVKVEVDSHNAVTLTKLDLVDADGTITDLLGTQGVVSTDSFVVALPTLAVGTYTVKVNGTDDVGNKLATDASYSLTVKARAAYKVALSPGFNLISLPGDPTTPAIDSVLPSTHPATTVLSYQPDNAAGPWLVATRTSGTDWSANSANTLTEIRSGHGYWVQTGAFTALSTMIPERDPSQVLPTFPVVAGWNLLGVVDLAVAATTATVSADTYLASITWTVAYTFDTQSNAWTKITKGSSPAGVLNNGQGAWVWSEKKDVLAP